MSLLRTAAASGAIAFALVGCARRLPSEPAQDLAGLSLPLQTSGAVALSVEGSVGARQAEVLLEVAQPIALVTTGCFDRVPSSDTQVRYPRPQGGFGDAKELELGNARIGPRRLGPVRAAVLEGDVCELTLGSDVLSRYALEVDPTSRTVTFLKPATRESYAQRAAASSEYEQHVIELVRDPAADWPMLAARVNQDSQRLTGAFVLTTSSASSMLDHAAASDADLVLGPDFFRKLGVPPNVPIPKNIGGNLYSIDQLELTPGFGLWRVPFESSAEWKNPSAIGTLGGDVWGRFLATIDVSADTLFLRRPKLVASEGRQRCATGKPGEASEEACFVLHQRDLPDSGVEVVTTVWRELRNGGQLHLALLDAKGEPIGGACQVGMSFAPSDRGATSAHRVPWSGLERALPQCASNFAKAAQVRFDMWDEGPLSACPGTCAFARDLTGKVACECQGNAPGLMGDAERRFMELYQDLLKRRGGKPGEEPSDREDEPKDDL